VLTMSAMLVALSAQIFVEFLLMFRAVGGNSDLELLLSHLVRKVACGA
jgi:hypothetical protein